METCPYCGADNREHARFCSNCGTAFFGTQDLSPGTLLQNRYRILHKVGHGGMGAVYLVEHTSLNNKQFAVKEIREVGISDPTDRAVAVQQFQKEAHILAQLKHLNLPQVNDFFEERGRHYLVMEYIKGETLEQILNRTTNYLPEQQVIEWAIQICDVLNYLHTQYPPIIFRDLKPSNVILNDEGVVKLIDFGIAKLFNPAKTTDTLKMGTPGYAPPEQYGGQTGTEPCSDLYALGAVLHHLITRHDPQTEHPFYFPSAPVQLYNPHVSDGLTQIIQKATAYEKNERYPSAIAMKTALSACLSQKVSTFNKETIAPYREQKKTLMPIWLTVLLGCVICLALSGVMGIGYMLRGNFLPTQIPTFEATSPPVSGATTSPTISLTNTHTETPSPTTPPPSTFTPTLTSTPTSTPTAIPLFSLPEDLSFFLNTPKLEQYDDFLELSQGQWGYPPTTENSPAGFVTLTGEKSWKNLLWFTPAIRETQGVLLLFKTSSAANCDIVLSQGGWNTAEYRRYGISVGGILEPSIYQGYFGPFKNHFSGSLTYQKEQWYYALLTMDSNGQLLIVLWEKGNPSKNVIFKRNYGEEWVGLTWGFVIKGKDGDMTIDSFALISYNKIK